MDILQICLPFRSGNRWHSWEPCCGYNSFAQMGVLLIRCLRTICLVLGTARWVQTLQDNGHSTIGRTMATRDTDSKVECSTDRLWNCTDICSISGTSGSVQMVPAQWAAVMPMFIICHAPSPHDPRNETTNQIIPKSPHNNQATTNQLLTHSKNN